MCDNEQETREQRLERRRQQREYDNKNLQYYSANVTAWFNTKLEKDKSIITISSAAIGLLVTIITTKGVQNLIQGALFSVAFIGFLSAIITVIQTLDKNAEQIQMDLSNQGNVNHELGRNDLIISLSFYVGIIFTIFIGISYGVTQFNKDKGDKKMAEERLEKVIKPFQGETLERSFSNSNNLKPVAPAQTTNNTNNSNSTAKEK